MPRVKPVRHEDQLTLVEHLDELRSRLIVAVGALVIAFALCFWQDDLVFDIVNAPLEGKQPATLGVGEAFMTTVTLSVYAAILLALPVILYQLYAFLLPAFSPGERRVALPLLLMVPVLFVTGVVFAYYVVLPPALEFLLNFNADEFNQLIRARDYYSFVSLTLISIGLLFQVPLGVLAATRLGVVTPQQLRRNRRYAIIVIAIVAALLPSVDPVTMLIEMGPLIVLYEASILLASALGRPRGEVGEQLPSPQA